MAKIVLRVHAARPSDDVVDAGRSFCGWWFDDPAQTTYVRSEVTCRLCLNCWSRSEVNFQLRMENKDYGGAYKRALTKLKAEHANEFSRLLTAEMKLDSPPLRTTTVAELFATIYKQDISEVQQK